MKKVYLIVCLFLMVFLSGCGDDEVASSRIVLGASKVLLVPNELQYQQGFVVQVTDVDGNPSPGAVVSLKLMPIEYIKGFYTPVDTDDDDVDDAWGRVRIICPAEDINNNGILDAGEDLSGNGMLDPTNPGTLSAHPDELPTLIAGSDKVITDDSGFGYFVVTYPVEQALWNTIRVIATTEVSGTEDEDSLDLTLFIGAEDVAEYPMTPVGGTNSPYGTESWCIKP